MFYRRAFYVLSLGLHVPANWRSALLRSSGLPARCCNGQCTFIQPCQSSSQRCWCVTFPAQMPSNPPRHRSRAAGPGSLIYEPFGLVHQWGNPGNDALTFLAFNIQKASQSWSWVHQRRVNSCNCGIPFNPYARETKSENPPGRSSFRGPLLASANDLIFQETESARPLLDLQVMKLWVSRQAGLVRAVAFVKSDSAGRQWSGICPVVQNRRQGPSARPALSELHSGRVSPIQVVPSARDHKFPWLLRL